MLKILTELFEKSLTTKENNHFTDVQIINNWIGNPPATSEEIKNTELRLGVILPTDYKEFLSIANGYPAYHDGVEPSFERIDQIRYLKDYNPELIDIWGKTGNIEVSRELRMSIIVAGLQEEQYFLLIPPSSDNKNWKYWKFASWIPGEIEYEDLMDYFIETTNSLD